MSSFSLFHLLVIAPAAVLPAVVVSSLGPALALIAVNAAILARIAH